MIKYIGFDKDGTLMDSMDSYALIWGKIFHDEYGINEKEAGNLLKETAGIPTIVQVDTLLRKHNIILPKGEVFDKANEIAKILGEKGSFKPFPEVSEVLKKLKEHGYRIFVSSGQQETVIKKDLEKSGLIKFVDFFAGIKPLEPGYTKGKAHFRSAAKHFGVPFETFVNETIFIGDTVTDIQVSKDSNITCIIRANSTSAEKLLKEGAKAVVSDFANLPEIIASI
jgi:phosphoglycolate phosphatase-like HAD superfamily hydrolase